MNNEISSNINLGSASIEKINIDKNNNSFETMMSVPELEQRIFGSLPPRKQIDLSAINKNLRVKFGSIINIRTRGLSNYVQEASNNIASTSSENKSPSDNEVKNNVVTSDIESEQVLPNIFNDIQRVIKPLQNVTEPLSSAVNIDTRKVLNIFLHEIAFGYGVKAPQYDLAKVIKWFERVETKEGKLVDHLTWESLEELEFLSREDGEAAIRSAAEIASEAARALSLEKTAEAVEMVLITQEVGQVAAQLDEEIQSTKTLSIEKLVQIAGKARAAARVAVQVARAARRPITKQQAQAEVAKGYSAKRELEQAISEIQAAQEAQSTQAPEQNDQALRPGEIHREILYENLINILSFHKKSDLINIFSIDSEVLMDWNNYELRGITHRDKLEKLMDMVMNEEIPFPRHNIGITLLVYIQDKIKAGNKEIEKWSRENGWDLTFQNEIGDMALHLAAKQRDWDKVSLLLKAGVDPWIENTEGKLLLHFAVEKFGKNAGQWLKENGLDLNCQNEIGDTYLHAAAKEDEWDAVSLLLKAGVNPWIKNIDGKVLLHFAVEKFGKNAERWLGKNGLDLNFQNEIGETDLHLAAKEGDWEAVSLLLKAGVNPWIENTEGLTLLDLAAQTGNVDLVRLVLEKGIYKELNVKAEIAPMILDIALSTNNRKAGLLLLKNGAEPGERKFRFKLRLLSWKIQAKTMKVFLGKKD